MHSFLGDFIHGAPYFFVLNPVANWRKNFTWIVDTMHLLCLIQLQYFLLSKGRAWSFHGLPYSFYLFSSPYPDRRNSPNVFHVNNLTLIFCFLLHSSHSPQITELCMRYFLQKQFYLFKKYCSYISASKQDAFQKQSSDEIKCEDSWHILASVLFIDTKSEVLEVENIAQFVESICLVWSTPSPVFNIQHFVFKSNCTFSNLQFHQGVISGRIGRSSICITTQVFKSRLSLNTHTYIIHTHTCSSYVSKC